MYSFERITWIDQIYIILWKFPLKFIHIWSILGNMFQCFTNFITKKKVSLLSSLNLSSFNLKAFPLVLSFHGLVNVPLHLSCRPLSATGHLLKGLPKTFSFPGWRTPTESVCLPRRGAPDLGSGMQPPPHPLQQILVFALQRTPELDTVHQVGSQSY